MRAHKQVYNDRGQSFSWDFFIGLLIFIAVLGLFISFAYEKTARVGTQFSELLAQADALSSALLAEGYPAEWDAATAVRPGITNSRNRVLMGRLGNFTELDYDDTKTMFGLRDDYLYYFEDRFGTTITFPFPAGPGTTYFGKPGATPQTLRSVEDAKDVVMVTRYVIVDGDVVRMRLLVWSSR